MKDADLQLAMTKQKYTYAQKNKNVITAEGRPFSERDEMDFSSLPFSYADN